MERFWIFIWKIFKKVLFIKSFAFWNKRKKQTFRKFVFTCYTWNIVNTNWRMKYFVWYCLNTIVRKFNNSNIGRVNAVQKKFFYLHKMGQQIKSSLLLTLLQQVYSHFNFNLPTIQLSVSNWEKTIWRHISFSSTCFCYYRKHPNNDNKICQLPYFLASSTTFMTDSTYLDTIQIYQNLNEYYYYLISTTSLIWQIDANFSPFQSLNMLPFHIRLEHLKLHLFF